jgi:hypothetical protein
MGARFLDAPRAGSNAVRTTGRSSGMPELPGISWNAPKTKKKKMRDKETFAPPPET